MFTQRYDLIQLNAEGLLACNEKCMERDQDMQKQALRVAQLTVDARPAVWPSVDTFGLRGIYGLMPVATSARTNAADATISLPLEKKT